MRSRRKGVLACSVFLSLLAACTPPIRQYDLENQPLTCEKANDYTLRTMQAMGFTLTAVEPAAIGRPGTVRATREERGTQNVTVEITCSGTGVDIDASEDGKFLGLLEFKRGFYLSFTAIAQQAEILEAEARAEALRPPQERKGAGLRVLIEPVRGPAAKLDFELDLAAAGVLPVRVTVTNNTKRTYRLAPADIVLMQPDRTRVRPLSVDEAAQRVASLPQADGGSAAGAGLDRNAVAQRLQARALSGDTVAANQTAKGYLFFPLGQYVKGRVSLEDKESEETEGFVVEF